jgi:hypothetical protein
MEEIVDAILHWLGLVAISGFLLIPVIFILGFLLQRDDGRARRGAGMVEMRPDGKKFKKCAFTR